MEEVSCEIKYSGAGGGLLCAAALATLALVIFVPFPDAVRAAAFAWVVGGATLADNRLRAVTALRLDAERGIAVRSGTGTWRSGRVRDGSFVAPWLTIVRWRPEGARFDRRLVLLPGIAEAAALRRARLILRWA